MSDSESLEYWLVSVPNDNGEPDGLRRIVEARMALYSELREIPITELRVGTLDTLIALSDELGKIDATGRNITAKLHRTYKDLENNNNMDSVQQLNIQHKSVAGYITQFKWDEGHFNTRASLKDLVQTIHQNMQKNAEHLRKRSAKLSEIESDLQAIVRKKSGSLMNKSLKEYVTQEDWYKGDYIGSALVVVPKQKMAEFQSSYEFFEDYKDENDKYEKFLNMREQHEQAEVKHNDEQNNNDSDVKSNDDNDNDNELKEEKKENDNASANLRNPHSQESEHHKAFDLIKNKTCRIVVPESAKLLATDAEFGLYRVMLLNQGYDWFKFLCRERGYNVRDFEYSDDNGNDEEKQMSELTKQKMSWEKKLKLFCQTTFAETFANWMHLKVIRCFVEAVLRYGLPVNFSVSCVKPPKGKEKVLLKILDQKYSHLVDKKFQQPNDTTEMDFSGLGGEFHPFVYIPLKIDL